MPSSSSGWNQSLYSCVGSNPVHQELQHLHVPAVVAARAWHSVQLMKRKEVSEKDVVGGSSCLKPACLEASLQQSLRSLRVDTVGAGPLLHSIPSSFAAARMFA